MSTPNAISRSVQKARPAQPSHQEVPKGVPPTSGFTHANTRFSGITAPHPTRPQPSTVFALRTTPRPLSLAEAAVDSFVFDGARGQKPRSMAVVDMCGPLREIQYS